MNSYEYYLNTQKNPSFTKKNDQDSAHNILNQNGILLAKDDIHIVENTCTSGLSILIAASQGISMGKWKNVLVCTIDLIDPLALYLLNSLGALSQSKNEPETMLRPFDLNRDGFVKTESASIALVSENIESLEQTAFMKLISFHQSNDAFRLTDGREDGSYIKLSMQKAFENSQLTTQDIAFIKSHGIGAKYSDQYEALAIQELFNKSNIPVTSLKGHLGHTSDASGLVENLIAGYALKNKIVLPIKNCDHPEFNLPLVHHPLKTNLKFFLSNAVGFGGQNISAVFGTT